MNDENRKAAVREELGRADEAYRAAELDSNHFRTYIVCVKIHKKQRTNVSINKELLEEAREKNLKLSPIFEEALRQRLKEERAVR